MPTPSDKLERGICFLLAGKTAWARLLTKKKQIPRRRRVRESLLGMTAYLLVAVAKTERPQPLLKDAKAGLHDSSRAFAKGSSFAAS